MDKRLQVPPRSSHYLTSGEMLAEQLSPLLGTEMKLTGLSRTDGSNVRKMVAGQLVRVDQLPPAAEGGWQIVPPKKKGVPKILREFIDTYIVTSGNSYNLQVWNRNPTQPIPHVAIEGESDLRANDVRFVFVRIDTDSHRVRAIVVAEPEYIVRHFGKFGKPTYKEQLIISGTKRNGILEASPPILFYPDMDSRAEQFRKSIQPLSAKIHEEPTTDAIISLTTIRDSVLHRLIGLNVDPGPTKNRGQNLERIVAEQLGYSVSVNDLLAGGYPDIRHQALEVKVQDAPTVDLGRYSPQFEEPISGLCGFTTETVRYLIALTCPTSFQIKGLVLCPGAKLGEHFTFVADQSYKCQRSIPMAFFDAFENKSVFNPTV